MPATVKLKGIDGGRAWVEPGANGGSIFYVSIAKSLSMGHGECPSRQDEKMGTPQVTPWQ